jgi:hypothetical protein
VSYPIGISRHFCGFCFVLWKCEMSARHLHIPFTLLICFEAHKYRH